MFVSIEERNFKWDSHYDANIGRFLQVDPDAGSMLAPITHINKYSYVGNNPINLIDPSGMKSLLSIGGDLIGFAYGGAAYLAFKDNIRSWATAHRKEII